MGLPQSQTNGQGDKIPLAFNKDLIILTALGLFVRLLWVAFGRWESGDTPDYIVLAKNIAFHHVFSMDQTGTMLAPTAFRPPLYPALISLFWWGETVPAIPVMLLQALLGAATVALVYLIARERFSRAVAVIASLGMALAPFSGHYTAVLMTETLFTFIVTLGFFLWGRGQFFWTGIAFGVAALTRPTMSPFLLMLVLLTFLPWWRQYRRGFITILVVTVAVASIWVVRNAIVFGKFIPVASSGYGTILLFGTIETKFIGDDVWTAALNDPVLRVEPGMDETEVDRAQLRKALQRIKDDPVHWLKVRAKQYPRLFMDSGDYLLGSRNVTIMEALREPRPLVILVKVAFILGNMLLFIFAALGLFVERRRFVSLSHVTLFPLFLLAIHLPIWVGDSRYSLPAIPLISILAAAGIVWLSEAVRGRLKKSRTQAITATA